MVKNKRNTHTDLYDLCSCYEPLEMPPEGTFDTFKEPEPTLENTSFYAIEEDGKLTSIAVRRKSKSLNILRTTARHSIRSLRT